MAYGISHFFPEGTREQYEATMIAMNGELGVIPDGQIFQRPALRRADGRSSPSTTRRTGGRGTPPCRGSAGGGGGPPARSGGPRSRGYPGEA